MTTDTFNETMKLRESMKSNTQLDEASSQVEKLSKQLASTLKKAKAGLDKMMDYHEVLKEYSINTEFKNDKLSVYVAIDHYDAYSSKDVAAFAKLSGEDKDVVKDNLEEWLEQAWPDIKKDMVSLGMTDIGLEGGIGGYL